MEIMKFFKWIYFELFYRKDFYLGAF
jgi:hypothetical protein